MPPVAETTPVLLVGLQEELFFMKRFFVEGEMTWYTTSGVTGGVDPFFVAQVGMGVRL